MLLCSKCFISLCYYYYCVPPYYKLVPADSSLCNKRNPTGQSWFTGQSRRHLTHRIWFVIRKQFLNRLINTTFIWSVLSRQSDILTPYLISELDTLSLCDLISFWDIIPCHCTRYLCDPLLHCILSPCDVVFCLWHLTDIWKTPWGWQVWPTINSIIWTKN